MQAECRRTALAFSGNICRILGTMTHIEIRQATFGDSERIARLVSELGYLTGTEQMRYRLSRILPNRDYDTLVASDGHELLGFIGTRIGHLYESNDLYGQIMALAVAAGHQRQGVGRMLMQAAESRLIDRGARVLVVTSGNRRADAHAFYESTGYTHTGRRYKKSLA
jgi:ribosomal protein S18 acetylase RimI-like enzyme